MPGDRSPPAMPARGRNGLAMRPFEERDLSEVLGLLQQSLGWLPDSEHERFFRWKHHDNPFGASPAWVAVDDGRVVGFRTFLRWEFDDGRAIHRAVRAVDTATHPDCRGRGIFSGLTLHALASLGEDGIAFVFNTPNDQSRPGYIKMGWTTVGRLPLRVRPRWPGGVLSALGNRVPAELWSIDAHAGDRALDVLGDTTVVGALLARQPSTGMITNRTPEFLAWRYGFPPLRYRVLSGMGGPADGVVVFRLRRRRRAVEAVVCEVLTPDGRHGTARALVRRVVRESAADYAVMLGRAVGTAPDIYPVPGQGPVLTCRTVRSAAPPLGRWDLSLGDIELF